MTQASKPHLPFVGPHRRVTGPYADELAAIAAKAYTAGASIRAIASDTGRSYGWVHRTLLAADVELRPRGGCHRKPKATEAS